MTDILLSHGPYLAYLGIALFVMLTGAGFPVPEEVFIIIAGVASSQGFLDWWLAVAACLFGALAGDCLLYWIGYHFGSNVLREHHWWTRFVHPEREAQMEQMIDKHGLKVLFLTRFLVGIRAPVYLSAGVLRVPFRRFLLIDLFCATAVIGTFFGLSYFLGERYGEAIYHWIHDLEVLLTVIVVVAVVAACIYFWRRRKRAAGKPKLTEELSENDRPEEQAGENAAGAPNGSFEPVDVGPGSHRS